MKQTISVFFLILCSISVLTGSENSARLQQMKNHKLLARLTRAAQRPVQQKIHHLQQPSMHRVKTLVPRNYGRHGYYHGKSRIEPKKS